MNRAKMDGKSFLGGGAGLLDVSLALGYRRRLKFPHRSQPAGEA
jgi:hypothetical protein